MPTPNLPPGFDFTDPDVHAERLPVEELAELRRTAPIWWNEQQPGVGGFDDGGFWVVSKHKDVKEISLRSDVFSSNKKTALPLKCETQFKEPGGGEEKSISFVFSDFKEFDGVKTFTKVKITHDGKEQVELELSDLKPGARACGAPRSF